jgi:hypothetical protein
MDRAGHNPAANTGTAAPDSELLDSRRKMVPRAQDLAMPPDDVPEDPKKRAAAEEGKSRLSGMAAAGRRVPLLPVASEAETTSPRGSPFAQLEQVALRLAEEEDTVDLERSEVKLPEGPSRSPGGEATPIDSSAHPRRVAADLAAVRRAAPAERPPKDPLADGSQSSRSAKTLGPLQREQPQMEEEPDRLAEHRLPPAAAPESPPPVGCTPPAAVGTRRAAAHTRV